MSKKFGGGVRGYQGTLPKKYTNLFKATVFAI